VRANPAFAQELLVAAAVDGYGAAARAWVERMRGAYPAASDAALARLAAAEHVRYAARLGAGAACTGLFAPLAEAAGLIVIHARLVLHMAAAYGVDPGHPERAPEILVLTGVYPSLESAGEAVEAARDAVAATRPKSSTGERARRAGVPLLRACAEWTLRRAAAQLLPGAAAILAAKRSAEVTRAVANRADARYRPAPHR
jgi:hypothetical protein